MSFTDAQVRQLKARLSPSHVKSRIADGQILSYLEGWHVIAEANRIFGFDGWNRETLSSTCVYAKQLGDRYSAAYAAKVRITVVAGERTIIREGSGAGEANVSSPGQAHEVAAKAAETDATKRALMTFGNPFGLSLYKGLLASGDGAALSNGRGSSQKGAAVREPRPHKEMRTASVKAELESAASESELGDDAVPDSGIALALAQQPGTLSTAPSEGRESSASTKCVGSAMPAESLPLQSGPGEPARWHPVPVDKSVLALSEPRRIRDASHLRFVATQCCVVCGRQPSQAHHLKFTQAPAMSRKVSDEFTVPLCALHHRELHNAGNERAWWERKRIEPEDLARALWLASQGRPAEMPSTMVEANPDGSTRGL